MGAWPPLLAAWRRGEAGVGDVSWAVASGKQRYARCTQVRSQVINRHYFPLIVGACMLVLVLFGRHDNALRVAICHDGLGERESWCWYEKFLMFR